MSPRNFGPFGNGGCCCVNWWCSNNGITHTRPWTKICINFMGQQLRCGFSLAFCPCCWTIYVFRGCSNNQRSGRLKLKIVTYFRNCRDFRFKRNRLLMSWNVFPWMYFLIGRHFRSFSTWWLIRNWRRSRLFCRCVSYEIVSWKACRRLPFSVVAEQCWWELQPVLSIFHDSWSTPCPGQTYWKLDCAIKNIF